MGRNEIPANKRAAILRHFLRGGLAQNHITPGQTFVLLALIDRANAEGISFPSQLRLMKDLGMSRSGVQKSLQVLKEAGWIVEHEPGRSGRSTRWRVVIEPADSVGTLEPRQPAHFSGQVDKVPPAHSGITKYLDKKTPASGPAQSPGLPGPTTGGRYAPPLRKDGEDTLSEDYDTNEDLNDRVNAKLAAIATITESRAANFSAEDQLFPSTATQDNSVVLSTGGALRDGPPAGARSDVSRGPRPRPDLFGVPKGG